MVVSSPPSVLVLEPSVDVEDGASVVVVFFLLPFFFFLYFFGFGLAVVDSSDSVVLGSSVEPPVVVSACEMIVFTNSLTGSISYNETSYLLEVNDFSK
mgnify:CR=1 FL=1